MRISPCPSSSNHSFLTKPEKSQRSIEPWLYQVLKLCYTFAHLPTAPPDLFSFIATYPLHERRGAASLLLRWGLECCIRDSIPVDLDSTADAGSLYARHGFEVADSETISMALEDHWFMRRHISIHQISTIGVNRKNVKQILSS